MAAAGEYDEPADDLARPGNKKRDRHSNKLIRRLRDKKDEINFSAAEKEEIDSIKWVAAGSGRGGGH
jgi:hypothetical protein